MIDTISSLIGIELSKCNQDLVLIIGAICLIMVISCLYDLALMLFGYLGGKRK